MSASSAHTSAELGAHAYSVGHFIHNQLGEHLPRHLQWLPACCDPAKLRLGYERGLVRLWTIALPNHKVIVFESQCERGRRRPRF